MEGPTPSFVCVCADSTADFGSDAVRALRTPWSEKVPSDPSPTWESGERESDRDLLLPHIHTDTHTNTHTHKLHLFSLSLSL